jgi:transcription initiation factor TFIID subunit 2
MVPVKAPQLSELTYSAWMPEQDDEDREVLELAIAEVDRYREMDRLNPSLHNSISIAALEVHLIFFGKPLWICSLY